MSEKQMDPIIDLANVTKTYRSKGKSVLALKDVTLPVEKGSFTTIIGPSGCGKSTLMMLLAGLESPTTGTLNIDGVDVKGPA
ncbi:MAG TPA: ATP-binding cassette domain-containing protein, partial [Phototrophicaceae bacterium]|nr:ATP-binding cassette domain-containing protein [Phototrophicaceae bacterium]